MSGANQLGPIFRKRRHNYRRLNQETFDALRAALSVPGRMPPGQLQAIQQQTRIPLANLSRWRRALLNGQDPFAQPRRRSHFSLPGEIEDQIYDQVLHTHTMFAYAARYALATAAQLAGWCAALGVTVGKKFAQSELA